MILYKYLSRFEVLTSGMLRFTQPGSFNDPFEVTPHIDALVERSKITSFGETLFIGSNFEQEFFAHFGQNIDQIIQEHNLPAEISSLLQSTKPEDALAIVQPLLMSIFNEFVGLESEGMKEQFQDALQKDMNSRFGLLCLTEKPDNELMWSHYADSHKGFAIGFKTEHPFFSQRKTERDQTNCLQKVIYTNKRPSLALVNPDVSEEEAIATLVREIFLKKSIKWKYEKEWRIIKLLNEADLVKQISEEQIYLFNYPIDCIDRIVIGAKCSSTQKMEILSFIKNNAESTSIKLYECILDRTSYKIRLNEIDPL